MHSRKGLGQQVVRREQRAGARDHSGRPTTWPKSAPDGYTAGRDGRKHDGRADRNVQSKPYDTVMKDLSNTLQFSVFAPRPGCACRADEPNRASRPSTI